MQRVKSVLLLLFTMGCVMPLAAQGPAEVWLDKASSLFQQKGVEIVFRINEEGIRIGGKLLMSEDRFLFDTLLIFGRRITDIQLIIIPVGL